MVIPCISRVLIVDNDSVVRRQLIDLLQTFGFYVKAADGQGVSLEESAKTLATTFRPHVVIMDLRLTDEHADDRSGLELWKDKNFASAKCILYSGFLNTNYRITREALRQNGVEDVVGKEDDPQVLIEAVQKAARKDCGCVNGLSPRWPSTWSEKIVLQCLYENPENIPSELVMDVIGRLFPEVKSLVFKPIEGGAKSPAKITHRRSILFQAWPDEKEPVVVKFAPVERIKREVSAYDNHIKDRLVGLFSAQLHKQVVFWDIGGICYSFIGSSQRAIETFTTFYGRTADPKEILVPLKHFFNEVWKRHYIDSRKPLQGSILQIYDPVSKLRKRLGEFPVQDGWIMFPDLPGEFPNPAVWILEHEADSHFPSMHEAITHGDLHGDNLFVERDHAWAIDFERSGPSHILRDFIELEQDIITRMFPLSETNLYPLYQMVLAITSQTVPTELPEIPKYFEKNSESRKAIEVIFGLRSIAHNVSSCESMEEYYWMLLLESTFSMLLADRNSPKWRRGLLLSSLLCLRLSNGKWNWPPSHLPSPDPVLFENENKKKRNNQVSKEDKRSKRENDLRKENAVTNINITIGKGAKVGDVVLASKIKKSFEQVEASNVQVELKEALKQLTEAVREMNQFLSPDVSAEVVDDLSRLVEESTKSLPNSKWYSVSIEGLIKAAENAEKLGEPVINLSKKILSLLSGGMMYR
jgi:DNA-binding NarL/FixJ family response regulator